MYEGGRAVRARPACLQALSEPHWAAIERITTKTNRLRAIVRKQGHPATLGLIDKAKFKVTFIALNMPDYYGKHLVPHDELVARVTVFQKSLREAMLGGATTAIPA